MTYLEVEHSCKVVIALSEILRLIGEIEAVIPRWPME
jgi:hypothetical protein